MRVFTKTLNRLRIHLHQERKIIFKRKKVCFYFDKMFDTIFFSFKSLNESHLLPTKSCANYAIHKLSYKLVSKQKITHQTHVQNVQKIKKKKQKQKLLNLCLKHLVY